MKSRLACFPRRWRLLSPLLLPWAFFVLTSNIWPNAAPPPCLLPPLLLSIIKTRHSGGLNITLAFKGDLLVSVYSWTLLQQRDSQSPCLTHWEASRFHVLSSPRSFPLHESNRTRSGVCIHPNQHIFRQRKCLAAILE